MRESKNHEFIIFHMRIIKIMRGIRIPFENHEKHENYKIPCKNYENLANTRSLSKNQ